MLAGGATVTGLVTGRVVDSFGAPVIGAAAKNFAVTGQDGTERCGLIVIDFGDGRVERNPDGSSKGVTLAQALGEII